jgi:hypothetical protein
MENLYEMIKALEARVEELESAKRFVTTASKDPHPGDNGNAPNRLAFMKDEFLPDLPKPFPANLNDLYDPTFSDGLSPSEHLDRLYGHRAAPPHPAEDPTDDELLRAYDTAKRKDYYEGLPGEGWHWRGEKEATVCGLRAVIARYGRPALEPVTKGNRPISKISSISEIRSFYNEDGECWCFERADGEWDVPASWHLRVPYHADEYFLPHYYFPVPGSHSPDATKMAGEVQP